MRGSGSILQIGKETSYGVAVPATTTINFTSESIKLIVNKTEEDSLITAKTASALDIQDYKVNGDFEVILKPENVGLLLGLTTGLEAEPVLKNGTAGVYKHTFTAISADQKLPSFTTTIDRHVSIKGFTGNKIDSLTIEAKAGDYIRSTVSIKGKAEVAGTLETLSLPIKKSFRFVGGSVSMDSTAFADVTSAKFTYSNSLDDGIQTFGSGLYFTEPEHDLRNISIELDAIYDSESETIRQEKYVEGNKASVILTLVSPELIEAGEPYKIVVTLPNVEIKEAHPNISGRDRIMIKLSGQALQVGSVEPVSIDYYSDKMEKYI